MNRQKTICVKMFMYYLNSSLIAAVVYVPLLGKQCYKSLVNRPWNLGSNLASAMYYYVALRKLLNLFKEQFLLRLIGLLSTS